MLVGSDGLFDNVYVAEILSMINEVWEKEEELFALREKLARLAIERGKDMGFWSPFAQRAKEQNLVYMGGKLDDTTVIVSKVRRIDNRQERKDDNKGEKKKIKTDEEESM